MSTKRAVFSDEAPKPGGRYSPVRLIYCVVRMMPYWISGINDAALYCSLSWIQPLVIANDSANLRELHFFFFLVLGIELTHMVPFLVKRNRNKFKANDWPCLRLWLSATWCLSLARWASTPPPERWRRLDSGQRLKGPSRISESIWRQLERAWGESIFNATMTFPGVTHLFQRRGQSSSSLDRLGQFFSLKWVIYRSVWRRRGEADQDHVPGWAPPWRQVRSGQLLHCTGQMTNSELNLSSAFSFSASKSTPSLFSRTNPGFTILTGNFEIKSAELRLIENWAENFRR